MFSYSHTAHHTGRKQMVSKLFSRLLTITALLGAATATSFAAGNLDRTFGTNGKAVTPIGNASDKGSAVAVQPDGKIVVAGSSFNSGSEFDTAVARYNADGTPDQTFGTGGKKIVNLSSSGEAINALALQADGKIVLAGHISTGSESNFLVVRFNSDGSLNTSFDGDGWANTPVGATGAPDTAWAVTIQNVDGEERIVVAGSTGNNSDFAAVRYKSDGSLDTSFDTDGIVITSIQSLTDSAYDVAIQRIGGEDKIVLAGVSRFDAGGGSFNDDFAVARYNTNGTLNTSFSTDGKLTTNISAVDVGRAIVIQNIDNLSKIVVGGISKRPWPNNDFTLVRYNENGSVDTTFGTNGRAFAPIANHDDQILAMVLQPDNKIIAAGFAGTGPTGTNQDFALARFNANGTLDTSFGSCGKIITAVAPATNQDIAMGVALQPDGKVVAAGYTTTSMSPVWNDDFAVVRYTPDGRAATPASIDFDADGKSDIAVYRQGNWYQNCSCAGLKSVPFGLSTDKIVPADYDGDGKTDVAVYRQGIWYILNSQTSTITGLQWGLAEDLPVVGDFDNDSKADIAVFRPANGYWYVLNSSNGETQSVNLGLEGDIPVPADYDGDSRTDFAVFRPSTGIWYTSPDPEINYGAVEFGQQGDVPVQGDYDGDGKADIAVFRPVDGAWYLKQSSAGFRTVQFGLATDIPVIGDYDGDSKNDIAVFRGGAWYIQQSTGGMRSVNFGTAGDIPVSVR